MTHQALTDTSKALVAEGKEAPVIDERIGGAIRFAKRRTVFAIGDVLYPVFTRLCRQHSETPSLPLNAMRVRFNRSLDRTPTVWSLSVGHTRPSAALQTRTSIKDTRGNAPKALFRCARCGGTASRGHYLAQREAT